MSDEDYCDTCDEEGWIVNDRPEADGDSFPWQPCPWCNAGLQIAPPQPWSR
jgi:hypothetical protein